ncbi:uncharacterized protein MKK02DRAFT_28702 [Dioszegia hungarica]|uniref:Uncharacterized protein n=1 Tax=Dioszegia hungarica TaxID=4972 RepID=A0AA38H4H5_9TREE|nr:uncharacterized protein MKK02DRAFT_28702 [Dioszegia hungarica]KAI9633966.1 hypothetical protein MKK02DRAFT_28702 [Dioszegia hungarica]
MSSLPMYRREADSLESASLVKGDERLSFEQPPTVPAYPPSAPVAGTGTSTIITYTFVPRWPIKGSKQHAIGPLGHSKERGIYSLSKYHPDQIEILAPINPLHTHLDAHEWGIVMAEAWASFHNSPPKGLKVQIRDEPGNEAASDLICSEGDKAPAHQPRTTSILDSALAVHQLCAGHSAATRWNGFRASDAEVRTWQSGAPRHYLHMRQLRFPLRYARWAILQSSHDACIRFHFAQMGSRCTAHLITISCAPNEHLRHVEIAKVPPSGRR